MINNRLNPGTTLRVIWVQNTKAKILHQGTKVCLIVVGMDVGIPALGIPTLVTECTYTLSGKESGPVMGIHCV